jgi:phosphoserine phosphatase RsbU/P
MAKPIKLPSVLFYGISLLVILSAILCFVNALSFINKPFPGFLVYKYGGVGSFNYAGWPGVHAGFRFMDQILTVEGQPVRQGEEVIQIVRSKPPGSLVHYTVESNGQIREVEIPTAIFTTLDFIVAFLVVFLAGTAVFFLGFVVYLLKPNILTSWVFFISGVVISCYMFTGFEIQSTYHFVHLQYLTIPLCPATLFHLGLIFPEKKRFLKGRRWLEYSIYVPALILAFSYDIKLLTFLSDSQSHLLTWIPSFRQTTSWTRILTLFCVIALVIMVIHSVFKASTSVAKQRAKMVLFGVIIGWFVPGIIMAVVNFLKINFPWNFLVFFIIFFPAAIAYSIVRHNLFDADVIIKRTVGYAVVTAIVVAGYSGVSVVLNIFAGQYQLAQSQAFPVLFTLGVILVFNPLRNRIQSLVDRIFFRKEYDAGKVMDKVGGAMTSLLELGQILKRLVETFVEDLFISTSSIMLLDPARAEYVVAVAGGEKHPEAVGRVYPRQDPLLGIIEKKKRELTKFDVLEDPQYSDVRLSCADKFEALNASLMIPLVYQNEVIGVFSLGEKKSGKSFNREDIELFRTIANQGAVAIENARMVEEVVEKERMEEELNIARDLQISMLPATCPRVEGFEIAALSTPAREVGGDFFDFIEMGEERVGLLVGDVTGKSVSGALVMSASRSVFRMLSEEKLGVGEIMIRANRRTKKDIKTGMFVALLYAVLDSKEKALSMCSAGQTQPVYFSSQTGEAKLLQTEGDTFPLGILEDTDYKETKLQINPGDKVVFYTDGIVEAMNEKQEIYGFERLLELVQGSRSLDAESLLKEIMAKVSEFVAGAPQSDDLTVIVVSVNGK